MQLRNSVIIPTNDLRAGMFVVALDRPWEETPFMLQGFVIEEVQQLVTLATLCRTVVIDPTRSAPDSLTHLLNLYEIDEEDERRDEEPQVRVRVVETSRRSFVEKPGLIKRIDNGIRNFRTWIDDLRSGKLWQNVPEPKAGPQRAPETVQIPRASLATTMYYAPVNEQPEEHRTRVRAARGSSNTSHNDFEPERLIRFDGLVAALYPDFGELLAPLRRLVNFLDRLRNGWMVVAVPRLPRRPMVPRPASKRAPFVPRDIELVIYRDRAPIEAEIQHARQAVQRTEDILVQLVQDISMEAKVRIQGLPESVDDLVESIVSNPDALMWVARMRAQDEATYSHSLKVAIYLLSFGRHLGYPREQLSHLATIGLLLDIGKIRVDSNVLNKKGALTKEEFEQIKRHVELGIESLSQSMDVNEEVRDGILHHHEWIDGSGYPSGLKGDAISVFGRMASIVDSFTALTAARPYASPLSSYDALKILYGLAGRQFHEPLVEQFVQAVGVFPPGTLVELSTGEVAAVVCHNKVRRLEPRVLVLTDPDKQLGQDPREVDLLYHPDGPDGQPIRIVRSLPAGAYGIDLRNFYLG